MGFHVTIQIEFCKEASVTVLASKSLLALMDLKMLVEVGLLSERMITALERTVIRSLVCVDPKVIEEVVPFSEDFLAVCMSASKKSYDPPVVWVLIFVDHELFGVWDMLVDSNLV